MGTTAVELRVIASLSSHNSLKDKLDQARWDHLCQQIRDLVDSKDYADIMAMVV